MDFFVANVDQCKEGDASETEAYGSGNKRCINVFTFQANINYAACPAFDEAPIIQLK